MIGGIGRPEQHGGGSMRLQTLFREEEVVARGDDAIQNSPTGGSVIGVQLVALPGVVRDHNIRLDLADLAAHLPAEIHRVLQFTVDVIEVSYLSRTEGGSCGGLLGGSPLRKLGGLNVRIPASLGTVGDDKHGEMGAGRCPLGKSASGSELDVVGVRPDR